MRTLTQWSVADYQQMQAQGFLDRRRCELINGEIWDMPPEGPLHRFVNDRGAEYLRRLLQGKAKIFEAHPITLTTSEPQPDIAIAHLPDTRYLTRHPHPEDIYWLIEVSDTTLAFDLETKRPMYAQGGIAEYWVIDVSRQELTVFRDPQNGDFLSRTLWKDGVITPLAFPEVAIALPPLLEIPTHP